jgi:hypothetical protein
LQDDVCFIYPYHPATVADWCNAGRLTIDMLPDVVLLKIFDYYMDQVREKDLDVLTTEAWYTLVHVCQKWRTVVFGSPRRLDLRLLCTDTTPVKERLAVWPPLPIIVRKYDQSIQMDNIMFALEHNDRVCQISLLEATNSQLEEALAAMQQPFPALTELIIWREVRRRDGMLPPAIPESFLGGSAPRLQYLHLKHILFPGLPKLILSATGLVTLFIRKIPHSGYFSPEAMVRCLSTLTRARGTYTGIRIPSISPSPGKPTSASAHSFYPPRSRLFSV